MILYYSQVSQHKFESASRSPPWELSKASEDLDVFGAADFTTQGAGSDSLRGSSKGIDMIPPRSW